MRKSMNDGRTHRVISPAAYALFARGRFEDLARGYKLKIRNYDIGFFSKLVQT